MWKRYICIWRCPISKFYFKTILTYIDMNEKA